uniref:Uncharacterized protein n=1 Tax=Ciona savignyi TaxID=51511 RepID=H2YZ50_CIOSA
MRATSSRQTRRRFTISPLLNMDLTSPAMRHLSHQTKPALLQYFRSSVMLEDEELLHVSWCHVSTQDDSEQASCVFLTPHAFHIVHDERPNPKVPEFPRTLNFKAFQAEKSLSYLKKDTFPITAGPKQVNIGLSNLSLKITDSSSGNFIKFLTRSSSTNDLLLRGVLAALGVDERSFLTSKSEGRDFEYQPAKVRFVFNNESTISQLEKAFSDYLGPYREQCTSIVFYTSAWLRIPPGFDASLSGNDNTKFLDVLNHVESSIHSNQLSV